MKFQTAQGTSFRRLLLFASTFVACTMAYGAELKPNIILLMADDMGMGDTSAYQDFTGNRDDVQTHTPNMERLARMGVRFTDAHTPSSRCTSTRYGLLTGRYPWRSRMKHWVLFGVQGDPLIEDDRPTLASLLRDNGYRTALVGKWHVGLRYRRSDGAPAAGWDDATLARPLQTTPLDHGFDFARFTSRSHGTSGPSAGRKNVSKRNGPNQRVGPGHIHGRVAVGATGNGKQLATTGPHAYVLAKLGSRHSDHAIEFLARHLADAATRKQPFFLYYPANSNHGPYTPDLTIGGTTVSGGARTKADKPMDARHDFIYENDVALGRLLDWLETTEDPRNVGHKLVETTLVIFTSDNGAEKDDNVATGPFRSNKGSVYEGGHRVPFIVCWAPGGIGDGNASTAGSSSAVPIGLQDLYATFADMIGVGLPNLRAGKKGAEDSYSVLPAFRGRPLPDRPPLFFNDHKEARKDRAAAAVRIDSPRVKNQLFRGQWKLFFDASLLRSGQARPYELYDLAEDPWEKNNLISMPQLQPLVKFMAEQALRHRNTGGHRLADIASPGRVTFQWRTDEGQPGSLSKKFHGQPASKISIKNTDLNLVMTVTAVRGKTVLAAETFTSQRPGLGISGGKSGDVDVNEALLIQFNRDVIVESAALVAGNGVCGGYYRVGNAATLAIYCIDADNDAQDQSGILSDIGILQARQPLRFDSSPQHGVEAAGSWRLGALTVRVIQPQE
ncbi:MAG: sulfatase-like hydrolase/transferase [Pirellulales bacterium]